jgi:hypothetical protein
VRLRQLHQGIPIFGRQLIVHLDPQERIVAVSGQFSPSIAVPAGPTITAGLISEGQSGDRATGALSPSRSRVASIRTIVVPRDRCAGLNGVDT